MKLPAGLTNHKCERFDPAKMGGNPPIRFVAKKLEKEEDDDKKSHNTVKIAISDNVQKFFDLFEVGGPESVVKLIRSRESLVEDRKLSHVQQRFGAD